jgi:hypothetical protein
MNKKKEREVAKNRMLQASKKGGKEKAEDNNECVLAFAAL